MPYENCYRYTATTYLKQKGRFAKFFNVILTSLHLQYVELEKSFKKSSITGMNIVWPTGPMLGLLRVLGVLQDLPGTEKAVPPTMDSLTISCEEYFSYSWES